MDYQSLQQRTRLELSRRVTTLSADVGAWIAPARTSAMGLSATQRTALAEMMGVLDARQREAFAAIDTQLAAPAFSDGNVTLLIEMTGSHELWQVFRSMLGQLEDPILSKPARSAARIAADCYALGITEARAISAIAPDRLREPPLVYLDAVESPATTGRQDSAAKLSTSIRKWRNLKLPLPIVLLPMDFIPSISRYCAIHHEVGHNLDQDLGLLAEIRAELPTIVGAAEEPRWRRWSAEILADALGVVLGGAGFALSLGSLALMLSSAERYRDLDTEAVHPPLALRVPLIAALLRRTGVAAHAAYADVLDSVWNEIPKPPWITGYTGQAAAVAELFLGKPLAALKANTLLRLNPNQAADHALAEQLANYLVTGKKQPVPNTYPPRLVPSAAQLAVWQADPLDDDALEKIELAARDYLGRIETDTVLASPAFATAASRKSYFADLTKGVDFAAVRRGEAK